MSKSKDLTKIDPREIANAKPEYLGSDVEGVGELSQFITPPRVKIIQKTADSSLLAEFGVGDIIITPLNELVIEQERTDKGQPTGEAPPLIFTPLFFYVEYCVWNPYELKGSVPAIRERSLNMNSEIARKARNENTRFEQYPGSDDPKLLIRFVEHLNFLVWIHDQKIEDPAILSFSRASHGDGRQLSTFVKMRKSSIYSCVFEGWLDHRDNDQGDWWALTIENPRTVAPWVTEDQNIVFKAFHDEFVALHQGGKIRAEYVDENIVDAVSSEDKTEF